MSNTKFFYQNFSHDPNREAKETKYYEIQVETGHIGNGYYLLTVYGVKGKSGKEAAAIGRARARSRHDRKFGINGNTGGERIRCRRNFKQT